MANLSMNEEIFRVLCLHPSAKRVWSNICGYGDIAYVLIRHTLEAMMML